MVKILRLGGLMVGMLAFLLGSMAALAGEVSHKAAIFPFELSKERQMDDMFAIPVSNEAEIKRLALMDEKLSELLLASGLYTRVDIGGLAAKIEKKSPLRDCRGCDVEMAREVGADVSVLATVHKTSDTLINISVFVRDVVTEKLLAAGAVSVRENNDAGWLRGLRSLMRNRILKKVQK